MNLILCGFKGSGKTTLGKKVSDHLQVEFVDIDKLMQSEYGMPAPEIYRTLGSRTFRAIEKRMVHSLATLRGAVIATGGGAVLDPENVAVLKSIGKLVYLRWSDETLKGRFLDAVMIEERKPIYEQIADFQVDLEKLSEFEAIQHMASFYG